MKIPMIREASNDKKIVNLLVLHDFISGIPENKLVPRLQSWCQKDNEDSDYGKALPTVDELQDMHNCGSTACIGGWVAVHPFFRKQGVVRGESGYPTSVDDKMGPGSVGNALFGSYNLFNSSEHSRRYSQKKEALERIEAQLDNVLEDV